MLHGVLCAQYKMGLKLTLMLLYCTGIQVYNKSQNDVKYILLEVNNYTFALQKLVTCHSHCNFEDKRSGYCIPAVL